MREDPLIDSSQRPSQLASPVAAGAGSGEHELVQRFVRLGAALHPTLAEMLNEHHSHQTERRGCGYTQATRFLADLINRDPAMLCGAGNVFDRGIPAHAITTAVRAVAEAELRAESRLLLDIVSDLVDGLRAQRAVEGQLRPAPEKLKIGSCPLAEQYFLEIAHGRIRRGGRVNVIVDASGAPLLLEKRGLGDEHSCISVRAICFNGVRVPIGSLFGVDYDDGDLAGLPALRGLPGQRVPCARLRGVRFLRLTTLAVAPDFRARAFSAHYKQQVDGGLFSPDTTRVEQLARIAEDSLL